MLVDDDWSDYESGPFCRHWSGLYECERLCRTCGHGCAGHNDECEEPGCECKYWVDPE